MSCPVVTGHDHDTGEPHQLVFARMIAAIEAHPKATRGGWQ